MAGGGARSFRGEFSGFSGNYGAALATITGPGSGSRWPHRGRGLDLLGSVGHGSMQTYCTCTYCSTYSERLIASALEPIEFNSVDTLGTYHFCLLLSVSLGAACVWGKKGGKRLDFLCLAPNSIHDGGGVNFTSFSWPCVCSLRELMARVESELIQVGEVGLVG